FATRPFEERTTEKKTFFILATCLAVFPGVKKSISNFNSVKASMGSCGNMLRANGRAFLAALALNSSSSFSLSTSSCFFQSRALTLAFRPAQSTARSRFVPMATKSKCIRLILAKWNTNWSVLEKVVTKAARSSTASWKAVDACWGSCPWVEALITAEPVRVASEYTVLSMSWSSRTHTREVKTWRSSFIPRRSEEGAGAIKCVVDQGRKLASGGHRPLNAYAYRNLQGFSGSG
ncbi:hypothetical protein L914_02721, partial [Phytophthora nicotianae]